MKTKLNTVILKEMVRELNSSFIISLDREAKKYPNYNSSRDSIGYMNKEHQRGFPFVF